MLDEVKFSGISSFGGSLCLSAKKGRSSAGMRTKSITDKPHTRDLQLGTGWRSDFG
jgi:hypothetical protein